MKGLIHIYTGDGKGKSTAAIGLSIRCAGSGQKVLYTQFLKDNQSSELSILKTIPDIHYIPSEKFFGFYSKMSDEQKADAKIAFSALLEKVINQAINENYNMLILDEVILAYNYKLIDQDFLQNFLKNKPNDLEVVMTGRNAVNELIELADYVSYVKKVKHPYDQGIVARIGIEN